MPFETVLMTAQYAIKYLILLIEGMAKTYCSPLKSNRQVDGSGSERRFQRVADCIEVREA